MIGVILEKELTEYRRDGRVIGVASLIGLLVLGSLMTGWSTHTDQQRQAREAQRQDQATFLKQGEKPPHSAAHFGRVAYKPVPALAVFDPGAAPYLGQAIWLEAHRQDPVMFRPAEDSPELRRLADLSVAGVLRLLVPLLVCLVAYGAFAAERERGTLRHIVSMGARLDSLFAGKVAAVALVGIAVSSVAICTSLGVALMSPMSTSAHDTLIRAVGLVLGYAVYSVAFAAVALSISVRARSAASALMILLSVWTVSVVVLPRFAASAAEQLYATPDSSAFWNEASEAIRVTRPDRKSEAYRSIERGVLSRALGREIGEEEAAAIDVNRIGLSLEISELLGARVYAYAYRELYRSYENQQRVRRLISILSPTIVLQHLSSALAGTDIAAHRHFALAAEEQRKQILRSMNEDMMLSGAGQGFDYVASPELWRKIPDFDYELPDASIALRSAAPDFFSLALWSAAALWIASRTAQRQRVL